MLCHKLSTMGEIAIMYGVTSEVVFRAEASNLALANEESNREKLFPIWRIAALPA